MVVQITHLDVLFMDVIQTLVNVLWMPALALVLMIVLAVMETVVPMIDVTPHLESARAHLWIASQNYPTDSAYTIKHSSKPMQREYSITIWEFKQTTLLHHHFKTEP